MDFLSISQHKPGVALILLASLNSLEVNCPLDLFQTILHCLQILAGLVAFVLWHLCKHLQHRWLVTVMSLSLMK